jgi:vitamin B12/bleomycin/antimicrobial peptide transport system ATP-binding/permease protein
MNNILLKIPWRRLYRVGKPFWTAKAGRVGLLHLGGILALLGAKAFVAVFINQNAGHFMTAIEQKSLYAFYLYLILAILAILVNVPIEVFYGYLRTRLALIWRRYLAEYLIAKYFGERRGLLIEEAHEIDNPEQRLTQDVDSFCNASLGLFISVLDALINVLTFITVLWVISPTLSVTVILYSSLGLAVVSYIGKSLIQLSAQQLKTEADLRAKLAEARAELVLSPSPLQTIPSALQSEQRLAAVIATLMSIMNVNRDIQLFTVGFNLLMPLIPAVIIAPSYFAGAVPFGTITEAVLAFTAVFHGATVLINQFGGISSLAAIANRLGELIEKMESEDSSGERSDLLKISFAASGKE